MKKVIITIGCFVLLLSFTPLQAEIIQIGLTGLVDSVTDPYNLLENGVHQNDPITGFYIYNSATPDSSPSVYIGTYQHATTPYGMLLTAGSLTFQTNPANVNFVIGLSNNYEGASLDVYEVTSYNNLAIDNSVSIDRLHWRLDDYTGNALSSDALPTAPLDLLKWQDNNLGIFGGIYPLPPEKNELFQITGHVTSAYLIPEPATLILLAMGALSLNRRSKKN